MVKRGQVTVFIIVGVLIVLGIVLIFAVRSDLVKDKIGPKSGETQETGQLTEPLRAYVESCIEDVSADALIFIGKRGGYYNLPNLHDLVLLKPYYLYNNENYLLSKEELENQLSLYINNELGFCVRNFVAFKNQGYNISEGDIESSVKVGEDKVVFDVTFPITVDREDVSKTILEFTSDVSSRIGTIYDAVEELILEEMKNPSSICISCIARLSISNELKIETVPIDEVMLFTIIDEKTLVKGEPYRFEFANKYLFEDNSGGLEIEDTNFERFN